MKKTDLRRGASMDAFLLTAIKLVTTVLGLVTTRLLSQYLALHDYGTYSQVLLIVSTVASLTILGMMDGVNYFYSKEQDGEKRESYIATLFTLQTVVSTAVGCIVLLLSAPLCRYFDNPQLQRLLIFGALLPLFQNILYMFQVLLVAVGKARLLAFRNLVVSLVRLGAVIAVVTLFRDVAVILAATVALDVGQILFFVGTLHKSGCRVRLKRADFRLIPSILSYCVPMAVFVMVNALNRDLDKYLIALLTDTETLAVYSNASKPLPFDIVMTSFCTVLMPEITRRVGRGEKEQAARLYKLMLELACVSTGVLCCAALAAAPQLMQLLYSEKYMGGLAVFCIYILVDLIRFTNLTLVLSAAGKTRTIMFLGLGSICANAVLNVALYYAMGITGPALATFLCTLGTGLLMIRFGAKALEVPMKNLLDGKYLLLFFVQSMAVLLVFGGLGHWLAGWGMHYLLILVIVCGGSGIVMALLHGKRLLATLGQVDSTAATE